MVRIRLLGELVVEVDGRVVDLPGGRVRSLLGWLALNRGSHFRSHVAARFWPDILDSSARASLRTAIWTLRRVLGPAAGSALLATRDRVGISAGPAVWTDATAFDERIAVGDLDEAIELAGGGELLTGLDEEWVLEARDTHVDRIVAVLGDLAARCEAAGDLDRAIESTRSQLELDPLAEDAHRELIRRLAAAGDRVRALEDYERLRERLRSELGLTPSPATRALVARLCSDVESVSDRSADRWHPGHGSRAHPASEGAAIANWTPGTPFPLPSRLESELDGPFVGRDRELEELRGCLTEAGEKRTPRFVLIRGEGGIGKTRLLAEIARDAGAQGAIALYGTAERDTYAACHPFVEALAHYVSTAAPAELRARIGDRGADLAHLLPGIGQRMPDLAVSSEGDPGLGRALDAAVFLVRRLSEQAPTLVALDDLQWLDASSAVLLKSILGAGRTGPMLVIGSCREEELSSSSTLAQTLDDIRGAERAQPLRLRGLDAEDVDELCRAHTAASPLSASVHAVTDGNPLFIREVLRHFDESGAPPGRGGWMPEGIRELIERRLSRLSDESVHALRIGAVIGREFELGLLAHVSGLPGDELAERLEEVVRSGLLIEVPDAFERFRFSHAVVRETLVGDVTRTRRARIHVRIAEVLEELGDEGAIPSTALAHHWCEAGRAGDPNRAIDLAMNAAERATGRLAHGEAVELYNRALAILDDDDERRRSVLMRRAVAYQRLEHFVFVRVHGVRVATPAEGSEEPAGARPAPRPRVS